jgi:hypothetical protein
LHQKGLVKVSEAAARRYAHYLTPQGFAEKSRLTVEYLSASFWFFRQARAVCTQTFALAKERNFHNLILAGKSDLAEIAIRGEVGRLGQVFRLAERQEVRWPPVGPALNYTM